MGERTLKQAAQEYGYSSDLCEFLDKLEMNLQLVGLGKYYMEDVLTRGTAEYTVVKVALANIGRALSEFLPDSSEKSRDAWTIDEWTKEGEKEFFKHCTPAGRFRYEDFQYLSHKPCRSCGGLFD